MRRVRAHAELGSGDRTCIAGAGRRSGRAGLWLFDRGVTAAGRRGFLARTVRRADSRSADAETPVVDRRYPHQRCRRATGRGDQPLESLSPSRAGSRAALCLAPGAAPLAYSAERGCGRRARRRRSIPVVWRFARFRIRRARGVAAGRSAWPARGDRMAAFARSAARASHGRGVVLGRQPSAALGIVARIDGATARAGGQCRRRHHGGNLQPDIYWLARRKTGCRYLHQCIRYRAGHSHQDVAPRTSRGRSHHARWAGRGATGGSADRNFGYPRSRHLS